MYNYFMLVGTITKDLELKKFAEGKRLVIIDLAVSRDFKNKDGEYVTDFVKVQCWDFLADLANETYHKGSKIGIKGRIFPYFEKVEGQEGQFYNKPVNDLIAERIFSFDRNSQKIIESSEEDLADFSEEE